MNILVAYKEVLTYYEGWLSPSHLWLVTLLCHVDAVTALPSLARGILDGITRRMGLTVGKGPPFVYLLPGFQHTLAEL